jgi:cutinase
MKLLSVALFASLVLAQGKGGKSKGEGGGGGGGGRGKITENDVLQGTCKEITFIMARASTEPGNMGGSMGPLVCAGLKKDYGEGKVACQGVGPPYSAGLADNVSPKGTTEGAIREATRMFTTAVSKCPNTIIVFGGYS